MAAWYAFADEWNLNHKVTFDGENKVIIVNPGVTAIDIKIDVYSAWKRWLLTYDYSKYPPAIRTIGGDPVGGGLFAGDIYFLVNGWQIVVSQSLTVTGTLYHDDPISPWLILPGGGVFATVSNLAYAYDTSGSTPADIWNYAQRSLTQSLDPTVNQIANAVWNSISRTLTENIADWTSTEKEQIRNRLGLDGTSQVPTVAPTLATNAKQDQILSDVADVKNDTAATDVKQDQILSDIADVKNDTATTLANTTLALDVLETLLKYQANRTKIDQYAKTLTVFDDDGVTPIRVFDLKNFNGQPTLTEVAERDPQ